LELLAEYGMFFAKIATFVVAIIIVIGVAANASQRSAGEGGHLEIKKINRHLQDMEHSLRSAVMQDHALKQYDKQQKKQQKQKQKTAKKQRADLNKELNKEQNKGLGKESSQEAGQEAAQEAEKNVYLISFDGDMKASDVDLMREEITAILTLAKPNDEVVLRIESPGGMVHAYGLAASQLTRFKSADIPFTVCVDKVAASGGYMMACIADKILAAPFAVIGSIGVVASLPNFNRVLKKHDVDYELLTAGEYKRTLTMLGENTEEGRKKFIADLEETHDLFKEFVSEYRPKLDIAKVATGETWYGKRALDHELVDEISTSDEYLTTLAKEHSVYEVKYVHKKNWQEKLGLSMQAAVEKVLDKKLSDLLASWNTRH
jgi:serine protease SohB